MGHPRIEAPRAAHCRVQHDQRIALAPRVGVVIADVAQAQAVAGGEFVHDPYPLNGTRLAYSATAVSSVMNTAPPSFSFLISFSSISMRPPRPITNGWKV